MGDVQDNDILWISLGVCCGLLLAEFWRFKREQREQRDAEILAAPEFVVTSRGRRIHLRTVKNPEPPLPFIELCEEGK